MSAILIKDDNTNELVFISDDEVGSLLMDRLSEPKPLSVLKDYFLNSDFNRTTNPVVVNFLLNAKMDDIVHYVDSVGVIVYVK